MAARVITKFKKCHTGCVNLAFPLSFAMCCLRETDGARNKYLDSLCASVIKLVPKLCPVCSFEIIIYTLLPTKCFIKINQFLTIDVLNVKQTTFLLAQM